jgi:hypothetical protein
MVRFCDAATMPSDKRYAYFKPAEVRAAPGHCKQNTLK